MKLQGSKRGSKMSLSKTENGTHKGLSPQMALLHQRWQQIRQLELRAAPYILRYPESTPTPRAASTEIPCLLY
jgi:hypothetical protein